MDLIKRLQGIYRATVVDNRDPNHLRRLRVKVQTTGMEQSAVTNWIWPAIGDAVFVLYVGGDPEYPVWIGEFGEDPQGVFAFGSWFSTVDQTAAAINTAYIMTVNNQDYEQGIKVVDNSKFKVAESGTYNLQFSAQLQHRTGGGGGSGDNIWIWLKKNGSNVANSSTKLYIPTGKYQVAAWNFIVKLKYDDYLQLSWYVDTTDIAIEANGASGPSPAVPSLIVTMNQIA
jgi:Type VI secretion system/phage-baseplate injector OB domain